MYKRAEYFSQEKIRVNLNREMRVREEETEFINGSKLVRHASIGLKLKSR